LTPCRQQVCSLSLMSDVATGIEGRSTATLKKTTRQGKALSSHESTTAACNLA